ncbi:MAG: fibronectin type III domain-containing protein, partial [Cyclobacteriaceae bacterium]
MNCFSGYRIIFIFGFLGLSVVARAQTVFSDNFEYASGIPLSGMGGWTTEFGTGTNPVTVAAGSLSFNTYGNSGVGNMIQFGSIAGDGVRTGNGTFIGQQSFYLGFLISVTSAAGNPPQAAITFDGNGNSEFHNSGFTLRNSGGSLQFGLHDDGGQSQNFSSNLVFGQVYFVVLEFDNSMQTGRFRLYINPPMNAPRPINFINMLLGTGASNSDVIAAVNFHQRGHGSFFIDGIRAATNWADIVALETPAHQATELNVNPTSTNSMNGIFTGAADIPTGYVVVRKNGSSPTGSPVDNAIYNTGDALGDGVVVSSGPSVSFTDNSGLAEETNYFYSIFSMNSANGQTKYLTTSPLSGNGFTLSLEPDGGPLSFSASSPNNSQMNLTFNALSSITNADGYLLFRSLNEVTSLSFISDGALPAAISLPAGVDLVANVTNSAQTSYNDTGLASNTNYTYVIVPYNSDGTNSQTYNYFTSSISSAPGLTYPSAPVANAASSPTKSGFTVSWSSAIATPDYRLDVATTNAFGTDIVAGYNDLQINGTSHTVTGLSADTEYFYRVRAVNPAGPSGNSNYISQRTVTVAPVASEETGITPNAFTANWSAAPGATGYKLDVATDAGFTNLIYNDVTVSGTNAPVSDLSPGTTYYYQVRALNSAGPSENSNAITAITIPAPPVATGATFITTSSFIANWAASTGASEYKVDVFMETVGNFVSPYNDFTVSGTSQLIDGLAEGVTYLYRVRAVNESGPSLNSDVISVLTVPPVPTALPATSISTTGFTANWSAVSGATDYLLYVTDNASNFIGVYDGGEALAGTAEVITGLQANTLYHYYVKATSSSGTSEASGTIDVLTLPSAPANPTSSAISQTTFTANWTAVPGITDYLLDVSDNNFTSNLDGYNSLPVTGTTHEVTGLTPGTNYAFRVRSKNTTGPSDDSEVGTVLLIPANPVAVQPAPATVSKDAFTAQWNAVTGVENYILEVSDNSGFTTFLTGYNGKVLPSGQTTEQIGSLLPGTTYYYRVVATNGSGESGYSNTISQVTIPDKPVLSLPTQITATSFLASWEEVPGATSYELDAYTSPDDFVTLAYVPGYESKNISGGTEDIVTGLTPMTTYRFRVRAKNSAGVSENSAYKSVLTLKPDGTTENPPGISAAAPSQ